MLTIHPDDDYPERHLAPYPLGPTPRPISRDELRVIERFVFEPGYAMAYQFLSGCWPQAEGR